MVFVADKSETLDDRSSDVLPTNLVDEIASATTTVPTSSPSSSMAKRVNSDQESEQMPKWLSVLGLSEGATWQEIDAAHRSLVSDLTPGAGANHSKVDLANRFLAEVNEAYDALRLRLVA